MSLFLPVDIIKAAANFFPLSCIPVSLWGEMGVEAFPKEEAGAVQSTGSHSSSALEYFSGDYSHQAAVPSASHSPLEHLQWSQK